jgi:hypothetical protein
MGVLGAILKGKKVGQKLLRSYRIKHGGRGKTITGVKPLSGKVPWWVGAGGKNPGKRANIVKTHFSNERTRKIEAAEKAAKDSKKKLKDLVETGQAVKIGERHFKK